MMLGGKNGVPKGTLSTAKRCLDMTKEVNGVYGNFWSPQKSPKSKSEQVPPSHWVGTYLA
jgi:hypothetical protein